MLAITPSYPPVSRVGAWLATHGFLRYLVECGHEVTVFAGGKRASSYDLDGVTVHTVLRGRTFARNAADDVDVVVSHATGDGFEVEVAKSAGVPHVRLVHGPGSFATDGADLLVANSIATATALGSDIPTIVCHPPVDMAAHKVERTGDAVTIVNRSKNKGIKTLWRVSERQPHRRFIGVKGGYDYQEDPRPSNWELWNTCQDMRLVWAQTSVLAVPSLFEAWGMVAVEAMSNGIPVIAHPTPGLLEAVGQGGLFRHRDDIDGWCEALDQLDDPAEYALASQRARERAEQLDPRPDLERFRMALEDLCA